MALATEPADGDVLARPPAPPDAPLVAPAARGRIVRDGLRMAGVAATGQALTGPAGAFSALAGAELGYALACRSPHSRPDGRFLSLLGATTGLHLAAIALPPLRAALRLPARLSAMELVAFGAGFLLPWATSRSARDQVVVRRSRAPEEIR